MSVIFLLSLKVVYKFWMQVLHQMCFFTNITTVKPILYFVFVGQSPLDVMYYS